MKEREGEGEKMGENGIGGMGKQRSGYTSWWMSWCSVHPAGGTLIFPWVTSRLVHCEPRVQAVCSQYCMMWDSSPASHSIKSK